MILHGDSINVLKTLEANSIEALVTDPPYGLSKMTTENIENCLSSWLAGDKYEHKKKGFMGKKWDNFVPSPDLWKEVYRVLKPGAHGLVFAGTRTQDLMSISLRLAGFEVRDTLMWVYGSGFPKSHNVSLSVQKKDKGNLQWDGWGTALKPAYEPIILIRKPLEGTVANNVLKYGVGGINIDATRIQYGEHENINFDAKQRQQANCNDKGWSGHVANVGTEIQMFKEKGRFPANVMIDDSIEHEDMCRYFYSSKASKKEKEAGLDGFELKKCGSMEGKEYREGKPTSHPLRANTHPTVKPLDLMRYLVKLLTPSNGTVLDPFCGSGSTLCASVLESFNVLGIEREQEYVEIAKSRLAYWSKIAEEEKQLLMPQKEELPLFKGKIDI